MKKIISLISITLLIIALSGCGKTSVKETTINSDVSEIMAERETNKDGSPASTDPSTVKDISTGIKLIHCDSQIHPGNFCIISVLSDKESIFTLKVYDESGKEISIEGNGDKTSDENGNVQWTLKTTTDTEKGDYYIVINQNNSNNNLKTTITLN